jgi:hypothetical protein
MRFQKIRVCLKELDNKSLECNEVHLGVWVEEVKVDLNCSALLVNKFQRTISKKRKRKRQQPPLIRCPLRPLLCVLVFVLALSIKINQGKRGPSSIVMVALFKSLLVFDGSSARSERAECIPSSTPSRVERLGSRYSITRPDRRWQRARTA